MKVSNIWSYIAKQEGGYVNNEDDRGGETKYGISQRSYPYSDIKNLTLDDAEHIFIEDFFKTINGYEIFNLSNGLALVASDFAFNTGTHRAVKTLQKSINNVLKRLSENNELIGIDGIFGSKSLNILKNVISNNKEKELIKEFQKCRQDFYESLPIFEEFGIGWTNRNNEITKIALRIIDESNK